jgi:hypothetical protein
LHWATPLARFALGYTPCPFCTGLHPLPVLHWATPLARFALGYTPCLFCTLWSWLPAFWQGLIHILWALPQYYSVYTSTSITMKGSTISRIQNFANFCEFWKWVFSENMVSPIVWAAMFFFSIIPTYEALMISGLWCYRNCMSTYTITLKPHPHL